MTDLEIMQRAKMYMDNLAQGIDPISGQEVPNDSVLNNVRLARCFFYVSGVLDQVIANGGRVTSGEKKFYITQEELSRIQPAWGELRISQLTERITEAVNDPARKRLKTTTVTNWLVDIWGVLYNFRWHFGVPIFFAQRLIYQIAFLHSLFLFDP